MSLQQLRQKAYENYIAKLIRQYQSDTKLLAVADRLMGQTIAKAGTGQLDDDGAAATAIRLYVKVAARQVPNKASLQARERLAVVIKETRSRLAQLKETMASLEGGTDSLDPSVDRGQALADCIRSIEELADKCGKVPGLGAEIRTYFKQQEKRPHVVAAVKEAAAKKLWLAGQEYEKKDEVCCAMNAYEEARLQAGAPSALKANKRLRELQGNFLNRLAQKKCREVESCHVKYVLAEKMLIDDPKRAKKLFAEIADQAPSDSDLRQKAKQHLRNL